MKSSNQTRTGATIVLMLFLLVLVFIFVAFAVDMGRIQLAQLKLQGASDFAARAGAEAMARGVGDPSNTANHEAAIRDEVEMVMTKSNAFGQSIGFDKNTQMTFGHSTMSGSKFNYTPTSNGSIDYRSNSLAVVPDLSQFPLAFGNFLGQEAIALSAAATAKVTDRDIVLVIDKSTSMLDHDAGMINVADYNSNLYQLEDAMYESGDSFHPDNLSPGDIRHTEFEVASGMISLSRMQALKLGILKFREQIDLTRGREKLGLTAYSDVANVPANAQTAPEPVDIMAGLSANVFNQIVGTGVTPENGDGTQHISQRHASSLESDYAGYDNFDYNYLRMRRHGSTNIADGIIKGADNLYSTGRRSFAKPILIVMTDGIHNQASTPEIAANTVMSQHPETVIYTITFGDGADQVAMETVATIGKGRHLHAANVSQLVSIFEELATNAGVLVIE
jgi:hypothetical protein